MTVKPQALKKPTLAVTATRAISFAEARPEPTSKTTIVGAGSRAFYAPEGYRRLTINLPIEMHKRLKLAAIEQDCTATEIIERLLEKELRE